MYLPAIIEDNEPLGEGHRHSTDEPRRSVADQASAVGLQLKDLAVQGQWVEPGAAASDKSPVGTLYLSAGREGERAGKGYGGVRRRPCRRAG